MLLKDVFSTDYSSTLILVGVVYGLFAFSYLVNAIAGMMANVIIKHEKFDWHKFLTPIWLILLTAFVMAALVVVSMGITYSISLVGKAFGSEMSNEVANIISSSISILTFLKLFYKGLIESWQHIYKNVRDWFDITDSEEFTYDYDQKFDDLTDPAEDENANMVTEFSDTVAVDGGKG